jgi:predicted exporter
MRSERVSLGLSVLVLAILGAYVALHFSVTTDVSELLPDDGDRELISITRRVADSELGRTMVLLLGTSKPEQLVAASRKFEANLRSESRVRPQLLSLEAGPAEGSERAIYELYHPRRLGFFAASPEEARRALEPAALHAAAIRLRERLAQPMSPLIARLAPSDPLLVLAQLFERVERAQAPTLRLQDGRFVTRDGSHAVLFLRTRARAFDADAQTPVLRGIAAAFAHTQHGFSGLTLQQSGVNRFAVKAAAAIRGDIERVSTLSTLGLGLLLFLLFRSLILLAVASIPLGAGFLVGLAACLAVYGRVHGVTLAFGSSLLGVALDFVEHLYCHQAVAPDPAGARGTLRQIAPALMTGAATTLVGFLALGGSGFRGLEEVALFSSTGLVAALITTFTMLPALLPKVSPPVRLRDQAVALLGRGFIALRARRRFLWMLPAAALAVAAFGLPRVHLSEDFTLGQLDGDLLAEDQRVRDQVARFEQTRFVVAVGPDEAAALVGNDRVASALAAAQAAGELGGYRSVAELLPSPSRQRAVSDAVRATLGDGQALVNAFEAEGFRAGAFPDFQRTLAAPAAAPLRFADLASSPLAPLAAPFRLPLQNGVGVLSFLQDVKNPSALAARLATIPEARFIDQHSQLRRIHQAYQSRTLQLLGLGTLGVLVLLALRYRDLRKTLAAFVPSLLGAAVTVACLALSGRALDLVALAALLMVISMGVDYGVFLVDASETEDEPTTALLSIFFAASTTVLGFGMLALSEHPMLSAIGMTAWIGMTVCAILAPTTLIMLGEHAPRAASAQQKEAA